MKKIEFKEIVAQRIYEDYLKRVKKYLSVLAPEDISETLLEINSHIYEM